MARRVFSSFNQLSCGSGHRVLTVSRNEAPCDRHRSRDGDPAVRSPRCRTIDDWNVRYRGKRNGGVGSDRRIRAIRAARHQPERTARRRVADRLAWQRDGCVYTKPALGRGWYLRQESACIEFRLPGPGAGRVVILSFCCPIGPLPSWPSWWPTSFADRATPTVSTSCGIPRNRR